MLRILQERFTQGAHTMRYPDGPPPALSPRFRGLPALADRPCPAGCDACVKGCPTTAIRLEHNRPVLDLGRCLFCGDCARVCPEGRITLSSDYRLATRTREALQLEPSREFELAQALKEKLRKLFKRSLKLRQVSAAGCNACEADVNVLGTIGWDIGRFGIQMVASPRHADGLVLTGPISRNMVEALQICWDAMPEPKLVIAVGACAISGGVFAQSDALAREFLDKYPPSLYVPGCPAHPLTFISGIMDLLGIQR